MYITHEPIPLQGIFLDPPDKSCGAMTSFVGIVRNHSHGRQVRSLYYESYTPMANRVMNGIVREAKDRYGAGEVGVIHRVGHLNIGDVAVVIVVSAAHRDEAFKACRFVIESIKKTVPIWKKEIFEDGSSEWSACHHTEEALL